MEGARRRNRVGRSAARGRGGAARGLRRDGRRGKGEVGRVSGGLVPRLGDVPQQVVNGGGGCPGLLRGCGSATTHTRRRARMQVHRNAKLGPRGRYELVL